MRATRSTGVKALQGVSQGGKGGLVDLLAVPFKSATMITVPALG